MVGGGGGSVCLQSTGNLLVRCWTHGYNGMQPQMTTWIFPASLAASDSTWFHPRGAETSGGSGLKTEEAALSLVD